MMKSIAIWAAIFALWQASRAPAAVPVEFELVQALAPSETIEVPHAGGGGIDRCTIFIDGKDPFPQGTARLRPVRVTLNLSPGKHRLDPGGHEFTVTPQGMVQTTAPALRAEGKKVKVLMRPVTFQAFDLERQRPAQPQDAAVPYSIIHSGDKQVFAPLGYLQGMPHAWTLYLVAGGTSYQLPYWQHAFRVTAKEVQPLTAAPSGISTVSWQGTTAFVRCAPLRVTYRRVYGQGNGMVLSVEGNGLSQVLIESLYQWGTVSADYKLLLPIGKEPYRIRVLQSPHDKGRIKEGSELTAPLELPREAVSHSILLERTNSLSDGIVVLAVSVDALKGHAQRKLKLIFRDDNKAPLFRQPAFVALLAPERFSILGNETSFFHSVPMTRQEENTWIVHLPDNLPTERYRLRVGIGESPSREVPTRIFRDFVIGVVNPAQRLVASLFLPTGRSVFLCGEEVETQLVLQAKQPVRAEIRLKLLSPSATDLILWQQEHNLPVGKTSIGLILPSSLTLFLKPSRYQIAVEAVSRGQILAQVGQFVEFISPVRSSLASVINYNYGNDAVGNWLDGTPEDVARAARRIFGMGFQVLRFDGWYHWLPGGAPKPFEMEAQGLGYFYPPRDILPDDPDLPAVEMTAVPRHLWRAFEHALRYRTVLIPSLYAGDGPRIETNLPEYLAEQRRQVLLHVQFLRHLPNYGGIAYSHWSGPVYTGGAGGAYNAPPPEVVERSRKAIWEAFVQRSGTKAEMPTAWHALGIPSGKEVNPSQRELWEKWVRFVVNLLPHVHRDWEQTAAQISPLLIHTDARSAPGAWVGSQAAYDAYTVNQLDLNRGINVICGVSNDDWRVVPYMPELMAELFDYWKRRGKPTWVACWGHGNFNKDSLLRFALATASHDAVAALYGAHGWQKYASSTNHEWTHQLWGMRDAVQQVVRLLAAYGEWLEHFERQAQVGILASFTQAALTEGRTGYASASRHGHDIYEAFVACLLAGYTPTFVYEDEVRENPKVLERLPALLLVNITAPLPADVITALKQYMAKGGLLLADASTTQKIPATIRLRVSFDEWFGYNTGRRYKMGEEQESSEYLSCMWLRMREFAGSKVPALRAALQGRVQPFAQTDQAHLLLTTSFPKAKYRGKSARPATLNKATALIYAVNDTPLPYKWSTEMSRPLEYLHQLWTKPTKGVVRLPVSEGVVYDIFEQREVPTQKQNGQLCFVADLTRFSGKIFALFPTRIGEIEVLATQPAQLGKSAGLQVQVMDDKGKPIEVPVPLEILLRGPEGGERYRLLRTHQDILSIPLALNDTAGKWTIVVRELLSGKTVQAAWEITPPAAAEKLTLPVRLRPRVVVPDRLAVVSFLRSKKSLRIVLDPRQTATEEEKHAYHLAALLRKEGRKVEVRRVDQVIEGINKKAIWTDIPLLPAPKIAGDIIVLGSAKTNVLITELHRAGILLRTESQNYPGEEGAIIAHVWSAFVGDSNALVLLATSARGLETAVNQLGEFLQAHEHVESYDPAPALEKVRASLLPLDHLWQSDKQTFRAPLSQVPPAEGVLQKLQAVPVLEVARVLEQERVRPVPLEQGVVSASQDARFLAVGTDGAFRNLAWLDGKGAIGGVRHVGERFVHQLAVTPSGEYVVLATTLPAAVFVLDQQGKVVWEKRKTLVKWGHTLSLDEPDYFALSPDGKVVLLTTEPQQLIACEITRGKELWRRSLASKDPRVWREVERVRFSAEGKFLAVLTTSYLVDQKLMERLKSTTEENRTEELKSLDSELLPRLTLLNAATGQIIWEQKEFAPSGWVTTPRTSEFRKLLEPRPDLDLRVLYRLDRRLFDVAIGDGAQRIVVSDDKGNLVLYHAEGKRVNVLPAGFSAAATSLHLRLHPKGRHLAAWACEGGSETAWLIDLTELRSHALHGKEFVSDALWAKDGSALFVSWWDGTLAAFNVTGKKLWEQRLRSGSQLAALADGGCLALDSSGWLVRVRKDGTILWQNDMGAILIP